MAGTEAVVVAWEFGVTGSAAVTGRARHGGVGGERRPTDEDEDDKDSGGRLLASCV